MERRQVGFAALGLFAFLAGCASPEVVVNVDAVPAASQHEPNGQAVKVEITDIRKATNQERTTIGGVSMGKVILKPPEEELVRQLVQAKADEAFARHPKAAPRIVLCGIREFQVSTPATLLYWDVNAKIELVLRVHDRDRIVSGSATERTYVWPSQEIIRRVTQAALNRVSQETGQALAGLLAE